MNGNKERELTYCKFNFGYNLMFKGQINYTEMKNLLQFTINVRKLHRHPHCTLQLVCEDRLL